MSGNVPSLRIAIRSRCYQIPSASLHRWLAILPGTRFGTSATHPTKKERLLVRPGPVPWRGYSIGAHPPERFCLARLVAGAIRTSGSPTAPAQGFEGGALGRAAPTRICGVTGRLVLRSLDAGSRAAQKKPRQGGAESSGRTVERDIHNRRLPE